MINDNLTAGAGALKRMAEFLPTFLGALIVLIFNLLSLFSREVASLPAAVWNYLGSRQRWD